MSKNRRMPPIAALAGGRPSSEALLMRMSSLLEAAPHKREQLLTRADVHHFFTGLRSCAVLHQALSAPGTAGTAAGAQEDTSSRQARQHGDLPAKMVSHSAMEAPSWSINRMSTFTSGNSSASCSARGRLQLQTRDVSHHPGTDSQRYLQAQLHMQHSTHLRFSMTRDLHPLAAMCFSSSRDILPAPMTQTCEV
jgi:hypothetical protein